MMIHCKLIGCVLLFSGFLFSQEKKEYHINTIAFYNLENLFHPEDDPLTYDDDRTPKGKDRWTYPIYHDKVHNMATVLSQIGTDTANNSPAIIGVAEIENYRVLQDLVNDTALQPKNYGIIQFDSPDRRGIDVGLLYQKSLFIPTHTSAHELILYNRDTDKRVYTRDQLLVSGFLDGDLIHLLVNHWPSRRGGEARSRYKRKQAATLTKKITDSLLAIDPYAKIIIMGDFNDDPNSPSITKILKAKSNKKEVTIKGLYNPMASLAKKGIGSLAWGDRWNVFDQIIISSSLLDSTYTSYRYYKAGIFNPDYLTTAKGKYKGYPFRSFSGGVYTGGYSDHYPVYLYLIKEKRSNE